MCGSSTNMCGSSTRILLVCDDFSTVLGIAASKMPHFSGFELSRSYADTAELMYLEKASVCGILLDL